MLDDSEQYGPSRSPALTYVNLLAISVELSDSDDETPPSDSWLVKMAMLGSPQEIRRPVFEQTHIRDEESPGLDLSEEKTRKKVLQPKHLAYRSRKLLAPVRQ